MTGATDPLRAEVGGCTPITVGAHTAHSQPLEERLKITRWILDVSRDARHPVTIITKSSLIIRDPDVRADRPREDRVIFPVAVATLDSDATPAGGAR